MLDAAHPTRNPEVGRVLGWYLLVIVLSAFGAHRWVHAATLLTRRRPALPGPLAALRPVLVQIPIYNERHVAERVIAACAALDWPRDLLEIQVLDDSDDETVGIVDAAVICARDAGVTIGVVRRAARVGFKAGALRVGLQRSSAPLIAIFDADFVPEPDFLRRMVPSLADPGVGMAQARWGHLDAETSWLLRAQATLLDGHFVVEHAARAWSGCWFNFNGTAGIWRREAIEQAGGWHDDTLTEDLDLSYRAQLAGWRFVYRDDVVVPAELPSTMPAFRAQQRRWARGAMQTARKLLGRIWRSPAPLRVRIEATAHLCANLAYPLVLVLALLGPLVGADAGPGWAAEVATWTWGVAAVGSFYALAVARSGAASARRFAELPIVLMVGLGMAVTQTRAVIEGLAGPVGSFVRTPKRGAATRSAYAVPFDPVAVVELAVGAWSVVGLVRSLAAGSWAWVPFEAMLAGGSLLLGASSLRASTRTNTTSAVSATPQVAGHNHGASVHAPVAGSHDASTQ